MSYRKIFWGLLLVIIGVLFILKNTGVLFFSWHTMWHLWPVILILWGISLIPVKDWIKLALSVGTVLITVLAVQIYAPKDDNNWEFEWNDNRHRDNNQDEVTSYNNVMSENFDSLTKYAELKLNIGVGNFQIKDSTDKLIEVKHDNDKANYSMTAKAEDSLTRIELSLEKVNSLIGKEIDKATVISILKSLEIDIENETDTTLSLRPIPREQDHNRMQIGT